MSAHDVVVGIVADAVKEFLNRLCECQRLRETHARDIELANVADAVTKALSEGREGEFGPVVVKIHKKFLGRREVRAALYGREVTVDELLAEISKAKSRAAWLAADCSEQALVETLYRFEDRYLIDVVQRNFSSFRKACKGETPHIDFGEAPAHVIEGTVRGIREYLANHGGGS